MSVILFGIFGIILILGSPIAVALAGGAIASVAYGGGLPLFAVGQKLFSSVDSFTLMAIPFFMLAGALMSTGGISRRLVGFANALLGWMPGGLGVVTIFSCLLFGALSGSPTATVVAIGSTMVPALIENGYSKKFSLSTIAAAGILGCIIPPSTVMITYSSATDVSVGAMFMAGILPGFLLGASMIFVAIWYGIKNKIPRKAFSLKAAFTEFYHAIGALLMPIIILGGIYSGVFTPTESAAVACAYGLVVGVFLYRELKLKDIYNTIVSAAASSGMIMFIISCAGVFGYMMAREQIPAKMAEMLMGISSSTVIFLLLVNLLLLIVGCFLETTAAILIIAPILFPALLVYGIDPVHFGIIMTVNLAIGMFTPPVGVNLFVAAGLLHERVETVINGFLVRYIIVSMISLAIITYVPELSLILTRSL